MRENDDLLGLWGLFLNPSMFCQRGNTPKCPNSLLLFLDATSWGFPDVKGMCCLLCAARAMAGRLRSRNLRCGRAYALFLLKKFLLLSLLFPSPSFPLLLSPPAVLVFAYFYFYFLYAHFVNLILLSV